VYRVAAVVLVLAACGNPASAPTSTTVTTTTATITTTTTSTTTTTLARTTTTVATYEIVVRVEDGEVDGGGRVEVRQGSPVRLTVEADVSDEVHVHGYDLRADVEPGRPATLEFVADIPGIFEVELEESHLHLLELEVGP
jgi:heme/copper-type cytochrome/quinol oxidase subunit 2